MKKKLMQCLSAILCVCMLAGIAPSPVFADAYKPYLSLGADLNAEQRAKVLSLLNVQESELPNLSVSYVTNAEEHQYLDNYMSASAIGKHALSSVLIKESDPGMGLSITTKNITVCTEGMYRNACATAGITDAEIVVAGPFDISGTAALVGIFKAYEKMRGTDIQEDVIDGALNELVVTGDLEGALDSVDPVVIEGMLSEVKQRMAKGELKDEKSIGEAVDEVSQKYNVTLNQNERQQIIDLVMKLSTLDIDSNILSSVVGEVSDTLSGVISKVTGGGTDDGAAADGTAANGDTKSGGGFWDSISSFFSNLAKSISDFFSNLFGGKK
ncbi:MAG: DUF1002 domain-containing protein [Lachnospiraceae bacterium]|nr:DUF1002 domain-containing protein [Lachnospiraceae bacterium]